MKKYTYTEKEKELNKVLKMNQVLSNKIESDMHQVRVDADCAISSSENLLMSLGYGTKVNEIAGAGYVAFLDKGTAVVCASGELPTGPLSDYDYISTSITIADVTNRIRVRLDPFLGKGLGPVQLAAMQTIVDAEFLKSVDTGAILKYSAQVILQSVVNGKGRVRIPYVVVPAFELREVNQSLVLAYDI